jgi:hypothetical protein
MKRYIFFITNKDGATFRWCNLTKRQAESINKWTEDHIDWLNVASFGWREME